METTGLTRDRRLAAGLLLGIAAVGVWLGFTRPEALVYVPRCPIYVWTGLYCPGCGTMRMLYLLVHGHPLLAFHQNGFAMLVLPVVIVKLARDLAGIRHEMAGRQYRALGIGLATAVIAFTVARNLPWEPFRWLAPQDLRTISDAQAGGARDLGYRVILRRLQ